MLCSCRRACKKLKTSESACFEVAARHADNPKQVKMHASWVLPGMQKNQNKRKCMPHGCCQACKISQKCLYACKFTVKEHAIECS